MSVRDMRCKREEIRSDDDHHHHHSEEMAVTGDGDDPQPPFHPSSTSIPRRHAPPPPPRRSSPYSSMPSFFLALIILLLTITITSSPLRVSGSANQTISGDTGPIDLGNNSSNTTTNDTDTSDSSTADIGKGVTSLTPDSTPQPSVTGGGGEESASTSSSGSGGNSTTSSSSSTGSSSSSNTTSSSSSNTAENGTVPNDSSSTGPSSSNSTSTGSGDVPRLPPGKRGFWMTQCCDGCSESCGGRFIQTICANRTTYAKINDNDCSRLPQISNSAALAYGRANCTFSNETCPMWNWDGVSYVDSEVPCGRVMDVPAAMCSYRNDNTTSLPISRCWPLTPPSLNYTQHSKCTGDSTLRLTPFSLASSSSGFAPRQFSSIVSLHGVLYLIGGLTDTSMSNPDALVDIWRSENLGADWMQVMHTSHSFLAIQDHTSVAYNDSIYVVGGTQDTLPSPILWRSDNKGVNWTVSGVLDSGRAQHASILWKNGWVLVAGFTSASVMNDVIYTDNFWTIQWKTTQAAFSPRTYPSLAVISDELEDTLILCGGWLPSGRAATDVWQTKDLIEWTLLVQTTPWTPRVGFIFFSRNTVLHMFGGVSSSYSYSKEQWLSADGGSTWTQQLTTPYTDRTADDVSLPLRSWSAYTKIDSDYLIVAGGEHSGTLLSDVYSADLQAMYYTNETSNGIGGGSVGSTASNSDTGTYQNPGNNNSKGGMMTSSSNKQVALIVGLTCVGVLLLGIAIVLARHARNQRRAKAEAKTAEAAAAADVNQVDANGVELQAVEVEMIPPNQAPSPSPGAAVGEPSVASSRQPRSMEPSRLEGQIRRAGTVANLEAPLHQSRAKRSSSANNPQGAAVYQHIPLSPNGEISMSSRRTSSAKSREGKKSSRKPSHHAHQGSSSLAKPSVIRIPSLEAANGAPATIHIPQPSSSSSVNLQAHAAVYRTTSDGGLELVVPCIVQQHPQQYPNLQQHNEGNNIMFVPVLTRSVSPILQQQQQQQRHQTPSPSLGRSRPSSPAYQLVPQQQQQQYQLQHQEKEEVFQSVPQHSRESARLVSANSINNYVAAIASSFGPSSALSPMHAISTSNPSTSVSSVSSSPPTLFQFNPPQDDRSSGSTPAAFGSSTSALAATSIRMPKMHPQGNIHRFPNPIPAVLAFPPPVAPSSSASITPPSQSPPEGHPHSSVYPRLREDSGEEPGAESKTPPVST